MTVFRTKNNPHRNQHTPRHEQSTMRRRTSVLSGRHCSRHSQVPAMPMPHPHNMRSRSCCHAWCQTDTRCDSNSYSCISNNNSSSNINHDRTTRQESSASRAGKKFGRSELLQVRLAYVHLSYFFTRVSYRLSLG
jgi:hypothetical protein